MIYVFGFFLKHKSFSEKKKYKDNSLEACMFCFYRKFREAVVFSYLQGVNSRGLAEIYVTWRL